MDTQKRWQKIYARNTAYFLQYTILHRGGGCWFCPNASYAELRHLREFHPDLWNKLLDLENQPDTIGKIYNTLKGVSLRELEEKFYWEDKQITIFDFLKE